MTFTSLTPAKTARMLGTINAAAAPTARTPFRIELIAPAPLDAWLLRHAELERLRTLPDLGDTELERLLLTAPAEAGDAGSYQAVNDGVVYTVSPTELRVTAEDKVVYRDTWIEYITPRFAAEAGAPSSSKTAASPTPTTVPISGLASSTSTLLRGLARRR